jgi:uncharacterized membrane protein
MAGISLPLRSLLGSRSFVAQAAGYAYAGLALSGPWLLTSLHMQILGRLDLTCRASPPPISAPSRRSCSTRTAARCC